MVQGSAVQEETPVLSTSSLHQPGLMAFIIGSSPWSLPGSLTSIQDEREEQRDKGRGQ